MHVSNDEVKVESQRKRKQTDISSFFTTSKKSKIGENVTYKYKKKKQLPNERKKVGMAVKRAIKQE